MNLHLNFMPSCGPVSTVVDTMLSYGLPNGMSPNQLSGVVSQDPGWFSRAGFFGGKDSMGNTSLGWGPAMFGMGKSIFDGWMGLQQLDLAKDNLNFQKDAFSKQFENQRTLGQTLICATARLPA